MCSSCGNVIIESFRMVIEYDADDATFFEKKSEYEILDEGGERISLEKLADKYFGNPELYFEREFE